MIKRVLFAMVLAVLFAVPAVMVLCKMVLEGVIITSVYIRLISLICWIAVMIAVIRKMWF